MSSYSLEALGCKRLYKRVDIDQEDDTSVSDWIEGVLNACGDRVNEFKSMKVDEDYLWEKLGDGQSGGSSAWNRNRPYFAEMAVSNNAFLLILHRIQYLSTAIDADTIIILIRIC